VTERDPSLAELPAPPIDPAFSERVQKRARAAMRDRGLAPSELPVPVLLVLAGMAYAAISIEALSRVFG
jgi:hypothetical protein